MTQEANKRAITYKRILNLGHYESKHLEITEFIDVSEDLDTATSQFMEFVERKIREDSSQEIETQIREAKKQLRELKKQIAECEDKLPTSDDERTMDDVPFDSGSGIPHDDPDPLRHFCSPSEAPLSATVNPNNYKRDWNQKIPDIKYGN